MRMTTQAYLEQRSQSLLTMGLVGLLIAGSVAFTGVVLGGDASGLILLACFGAGALLAAISLKDWRAGVPILFVWIVLEDLARKYVGNQLIVYAVKDILALATYTNYFLAVRRGQEDRLKASVTIPILLCVAWAVCEMLNPGIDNYLVPVLGFRMSFFYVPLLYLGYAYVKNAEGLRKFYMLLVATGTAIGILGLMQSFLGLSFLNPASAAHLRLDLVRKSSLGGEIPRPNATFVDAGRFAQYIFAIFFITLGLVCLLTISSKFRKQKKSTWAIWLALAIVLATLVVSGQRVAIASLVVALPGFLLAILMRSRGRGKGSILTRVLGAAILGYVILIFWLPERLQSASDFYSESMNPLAERTNYYVGTPVQIAEFARTLSTIPWIGYGTGTASVGMQYVYGDVAPSERGGVEGGFSAVLWEWGLIGLVLWLWWSVALVKDMAQALSRVSSQGLYWLGVSTALYIVLILFPWFMLGFQIYQNYLTNAYVWFLAGVVLKLPKLAES